MRRTISAALGQAAVLLVAGGIVGVAANASNPQGIDLGRDYFASSPTTPDEPGEDPLDDANFQLVAHEDVVDWHQGDEFLAGQIIFIDARDDKHYAEGHIPGAYQLDHYFVDRYLEAVLPACRDASRIILYCNGGKCEDSKLATLDLVEYGVAPDKLHVYIGGVVAWVGDGLPVESGPRGSGELVYKEPE